MDLETPVQEPGEPPGDHEPPEQTGRPCANCNKPAMGGDHPTPLCTECRRQFTSLTIPLWIKVFAGGIGVILLFSLFSLPESFSLGIHLHRGEKAMEQHRYNTAETELKQVVKKVPKNSEASGNLLIAAFYNQDFPTLAEQMKSLQGASIGDNQELFSRIDEVVEKFGRYISNDSFENFRLTHPVPAQTADTAWRNYFSHNPEDRYAMMDYAALLFDRKDYAHCDSLVQLVLKGDDEYIAALMLGASLKREQDDPEGAFRYSRKILGINQESSLGMDTEARTFLKQKKDAQALDLSLKAYRLHPQDEYAIATLIMAYHFNGHNNERDALIKKARAASTDSSGKAALQYAFDVVNKKENFR